jgi:SAM-dependent methyltransferase
MSAKNLHTVGVDISGEAIQQFKRRHGEHSAFQVDFTLKQPPLPSGPFDVVLIMGGIHHMVRDLDTVFQNIHDNLVVNGMVVFVEPNRLFLNSIRRRWYRRSRYFDSDTEEAIDHDEIAFVYRDLFSTKQVRYFGGPGFFVILQSLILRTPKWIKTATYRPLTAIDKAMERILPSRLLPAFVAVWHRR